MTPENNILIVTPRMEELAALCRSNTLIEAGLYREYDVKRGLRDVNGKGVLAGLTNISDIIAQREVDGILQPCPGELYYRGIRIEELVQGFVREGRKGYEEVAYLLLFGRLPDAKELGSFKSLLAQGRTLPTNFTRDVIMKAPTHDMMNSLSRSVLTLASYDESADDISLPNVLRQCLMLIAVFPMLAVYSYHAYNHYECGASMYIHYPSDSLSTASNLLRMLRPDMQYTPLEASVLDLALVLHMEHGGGNNSSFTTHVVTSSGTDTYSVISAALGSLKGPKHGGANYKVVQMFEDMKREVSDPTDEAEVTEYLKKLLRREAFDRKGLIYGVGHAVYSVSDPPRSAASTRASRSTWISIRASCIPCSVCRPSCIRRCSPSRVSSAGAHTVWRSWSIRTRSSVRHTAACGSTRNIRRCASESNIKKSPPAHRDLGETRRAEDFPFRTANWENCDMEVPLDSHVRDIL